MLKEGTYCYGHIEQLLVEVEPLLLVWYKCKPKYVSLTVLIVIFVIV